MRAETDLAKLHSFMESLGRSVSSEGKIYLTGGATAILTGWRAMTIDIDLKADPEPKGFFECLSRLKEDLDVNIELACPSQFIPKLPGWRERSLFIARHGRLDFFHYDLYSQALSKIERSHARDLADVEAMALRKLIEPGRLFDFFQAIEADLIRYPSIEARSFREAVIRFCQTKRPDEP